MSFQCDKLEIKLDLESNIAANYSIVDNCSFDYNDFKIQITSNKKNMNIIISSSEKTDKEFTKQFTLIYECIQLLIGYFPNIIFMNYSLNNIKINNIEELNSKYNTRAQFKHNNLFIFDKLSPNEFKDIFIKLVEFRNKYSMTYNTYLISTMENNLIDIATTNILQAFDSLSEILESTKEKIYKTPDNTILKQIKEKLKDKFKSTINETIKENTNNILKEFKQELDIKYENKIENLLINDMKFGHNTNLETKLRYLIEKYKDNLFKWEYETKEQNEGSYMPINDFIECCTDIRNAHSHTREFKEKYQKLSNNGVSIDI